jgi:hypothetical protein
MMAGGGGAGGRLFVGLIDDSWRMAEQIDALIFYASGHHFEIGEVTGGAIFR